LIRVYTRAPCETTGRERLFTLRRSRQTLIDVARRVHRDMAGALQYARVRGGRRSTRAGGRHVKREHMLADGDTVEQHVQGSKAHGAMASDRNA